LRVSLRSALACAILGTAGCTQILGFGDEYYLAGDDAAVRADASLGDDAPVGDDAAGSEAGEAGAGDSTGLDSDVDAMKTPDGPADDGEAGAPSFCQSLRPSPLFCDDFDEGLPLASQWSYLHQIQGALATYRSASTSAPASMQAQSSVVMGSNVVVDTAAYQVFSLTGQTFSGSIDLDVRVDQVDSSTGVAVLAQFGLVDGAGNGSYYLQFVVISNGAGPLSLSINEDYFATSTTGSPTNHPINATIPLRGWAHVQLSMTVPFAGGAGTAQVRINGGAANTAPIQVGVSNFTQTIGVGLPYVSTPSNGWTVLVDNVVFSTN
jgi:hypothetical protein